MTNKGRKERKERRAALTRLVEARVAMSDALDKIDALGFELNECLDTQERVLQSKYWDRIEREGRASMKQIAKIQKQLAEMEADYDALRKELS